MGTKRNGEIATYGVELAKLEVHAEKDGQRVMYGYASAFDYPIPEYDGGTTWFDQGAWGETLKRNSDAIQVLYHHGQDPEIGEKPLGVPRVMREDSHGLYTETPLAPTRYNSETIIPLLESGALRSMSVQFVASAVRNAEDGRHITKAHLREFGPTPFPRNLGADAAIHSLTLGEFLEADGELANMFTEDHQPGAPGDSARVTWEAQATTRLLAFQREQEAFAAWLTREGGNGGNPRADQGAAR